MNILDIIEKKKMQKTLSNEEIEFFIKGYTNDEIPDYQAAALIMAICINGMTIEEITNLTLAMANSGETLDLNEIAPNTVDKHSTGGIGDKITLILTPIMAEMGVPIAKMSGRGLGITGGTIDKLEAIPGFKTDLSIEEFKKNVKKIGISLIGQSKDLAPADKKIYALRDTIGCTNSLPLIASSIMSKKIAAGANNIILDVTCGKGAFMTNKSDAKTLAKVMKRIGEDAGKKVICVLTNMNEPIGYSIGNSLEIIEAVNCLKGDMPKDIKEIVLTFGAYILKMAGKGNNISENRKNIIKEIESKGPYKKFIELVKAQGGDESYIKDLKKFEKAPIITPVIANKDGYVQSLNAKAIGKASLLLGSGRLKKEDEIDSRVGIVLCKKISDKVNKDEVLAYIHANSVEKANEAVDMVKNAYNITEIKMPKPKVVLDAYV